MRRSVIVGLLHSPADAAGTAAASQAGAAGTGQAAATGAAATGAAATGAAAGADAAAAAAAAAASQAGAAGTGQAAAGTDAAAAAAAAAAEARVVPETYELAIPENSTLDQTDVDEVSAIAKANGWTNEEAQAALGKMHEQLAAQTARFTTELQAHPEVGGANLEQAQTNARRVLDKYLPADSPEGKTFRMAMNKSGYGNYAPLVVLLARIGKAMGEDTPITTDQNRGSSATDMAELFYGKTGGVSA